MGGANLAFKESLRFGQTGESAIAHWLRKRGHSVMPVYEKILDTGKGPQLFLPEGCLIAPDMLAYKGSKVMWIEAKHKSAFTWHRNTNKWVTGIDTLHYEDYCKVGEQSPWAVWLLFVQRGGQAVDSPPDSPAGLYGNSLGYLCKHINHTWNSPPMVYWNIGDLKYLAPLEEIENGNL